MVTKLTKHGDGLALVIDQPMLDMLSIDAETPLSIGTDGESLIVSPTRDEEDEERFRAAMEKAHRQYGGMLKRLAE